MMLIECPLCGPRNELEFQCGGESHIIRPDIDCSDEMWANYLFFRSNPRGVTFERWRHGYGCGCWFNVARDTRNHKIHAVYQMADLKPDMAAENPQ